MFDDTHMGQLAELHTFQWNGLRNIYISRTEELKGTFTFRKVGNFPASHCADKSDLVV
jgi:hypothetical protein